MPTISYNSYVEETAYLINNTFNETLQLHFKSTGCFKTGGSMDFGCVVRASCELAVNETNRIYFLLVLVPFIVYAILWLCSKIDKEIYDNFNTSYDIVKEEIVMGGFMFISCSGAVLIWYSDNFDKLYNMVVGFAVFYGIVWLLGMVYSYYKKKYIV